MHLIVKNSKVKIYVVLVSMF